MTDIKERLRRIGNAGSTESRIALEAARYIEELEAERDDYQQRCDQLAKLAYVGGT